MNTYSKLVLDISENRIPEGATVALLCPEGIKVFQHPLPKLFNALDWPYKVMNGGRKVKVNDRYIIFCGVNHKDVERTFRGRELFDVYVHEGAFPSRLAMDYLNTRIRYPNGCNEHLGQRWVERRDKM